MKKKKSYKEIREEILSGKGVIKLSDKESIEIFKDLNRPQIVKIISPEGEISYKLNKKKKNDKPKRTKNR